MGMVKYLKIKDVIKEIILLLIPIIMISVGQTIVKFGAVRINESKDIFIILLLAIGYMFLILRGFVWIFILRKMDLIIAYPFISLTYIIILLISYFVFKEQINIFQILGSLIIISGIIFITVGNIKNKEL